MTPMYAFFCDFDGTISETDMIVRIVTHFAPTQTKPIVDRVVSREITVQAGVEAMFAKIRSEQYPEVVAFAREMTRIRQGFAAFVQYTAARAWPFTVVSGGFDFFVEPALADVRDLVNVACNRIDSSGRHLRVVWHTICDATCDGGCGLCKPTVLRRNDTPFVKQIVIGDGVTDVKAARLADYVFARDQLEKICVEENIPHTRFDTFTDIERAIESGVPVNG